MARLGLPITFLSSVGGQKAAQSGGAIKSGPAQKTAPAARPAPAVPQKPSVAPTKPRPASTLSSLAAYGDSDESASDSEAGGFGPQPAAAGAGPAASVASASASAAADADDVDAPIEQARQRARLAESSASSAGGNLPPSATVALPPPAPLPAAPVQLAESSSAISALPSARASTAAFAALDDADEYSSDDDDEDTTTTADRRARYLAQQKQQQDAPTSTSAPTPEAAFTAASAPLSSHVTLRGHSRAVTALALAPGCGRVASGGLDGKLCVYEFGGLDSGFTPWQEKDVREGHGVRQLEYSARGDRLLCVTNSPQPEVRDAAGKLLTTFIKGYPYITDLRHTKGHTVSCVSGSWRPHAEGGVLTCAEDGSLRLWDVESAERSCVETIKLKPATPAAPAAGAVAAAAAAGAVAGVGMRLQATACAWAADGRSFAAAATDGALRVYDALVGSKYLYPSVLLAGAHATGTRTSCVAFAPGAPHLLLSRGGDGDCGSGGSSGSGSGNAWGAGARWTLAAFAMAARAPGDEEDEDESAVERRLQDAHARAGTLKIWDLRSPRVPLAVVGGLGNRFDGTDFCWSPDGAWVATGVSAITAAAAGATAGAGAAAEAAAEAGAVRRARQQAEEARVARGFVSGAGASVTELEDDGGVRVKRERTAHSHGDDDNDDNVGNGDSNEDDRTRDDNKSNDGDDGDEDGGHARAATPRRTVGGVAFVSTGSWTHARTEPLAGGSCGVRVRWPARLNQLFVSTSAGETQVWYDRQRSNGGVLPALGKRARAAPGTDVALEYARYDGRHVFAPGGADDPEVQRRRARAAADKALQMEAPKRNMVGSESSVSLHHSLLKDIVAKTRKIGAEDPREALLKYSEGPSWVDGAYKETQPRTLLQQGEDEVEVELDPTAGRAKVLGVKDTRPKK